MATTSSKKPVKTSTKAPTTPPGGGAAKTADSKSVTSKKTEPKKQARKASPVKSAASKRDASTSRRAPTGEGAEAVTPEKVSSTPAGSEKKTVAAGTDKAPNAVETQSSRVREDEKPLKLTGKSRQIKKTDKDPESAGSGKTKVLRDRYSIPEDEHKEIAALKKRCDKHGRQVKKSYLLRAGLQSLAQMDDNELLAAIERVR